MSSERSPKEVKHKNSAHPRDPETQPATSLSAQPDYARVAALQRTIGNQAVQRLIAQGQLSTGKPQLHTKPAAESDIEEDPAAPASGEAIQRMSASPPPIDDAGSSRRDVIARSPASDLIDKHTTLNFLNEEALGRDLLPHARQGNYTFIYQVLDTLGSTDRDDVSLELMQVVDADTLSGFAQAEGGRRMLDRLFDELTSGQVGDDEQIQADRIIRAKAQNVPTEQFPQGPAAGKVFPFRLPGLTVLSDAPMTAERRGEGKIWVKMPVRVLGTDMFREETRTLPTETFVSGIELPENEIIGVKMYDLGGETLYRPALFLVQLSNQTDTTILEKIAETAGIALTLGSGALAGLGVEATMAARVLLWADRIAFGLGVITSAIREHRGWIIERFGEQGKTFLHYVDLVNSAVMIYGGARVVLGMGQLIRGFRSSYQTWRGVTGAAEGELGTAERGVVQQVNQQGDEFLQNADNITGAREPGANPAQGETPGGASGQGPAPAAPEAPPQEAPPSRGPTPLAPPRQPETPAQMVARLRAEGEEVIVNIGGTGARHEPPHAINLNPNQVAPRTDIPNHVAQPGEMIGSLFEAGSVDRVVGHHLPPNVLNWDQVAPGAFSALRSGGRFEIYFRGAHPEDAARLVNALRQAGFVEIQEISHVLFRAVKP